VLKHRRLRLCRIAGEDRVEDSPLLLGGTHQLVRLREGLQTVQAAPVAVALDDLDQFVVAIESKQG
jgi:hypothetical protein